MAVAGDCNKCGFPVDEGTQVLGISCNCELEQFNCQPDILFKVMLGEQLLHPGCHGRGAPRRAWRNSDGGASQPYGSIDSDVIFVQCQCFLDDFVNIRPEDKKRVTTKPQHGERGQGEDQQSD